MFMLLALTKKIDFKFFHEKIKYVIHIHFIVFFGLKIKVKLFNLFSIYTNKIIFLRTLNIFKTNA